MNRCVIGILSTLRSLLRLGILQAAEDVKANEYSIMLQLVKLTFLDRYASDLKGL